MLHLSCVRPESNGQPGTFSNLQTSLVSSTWGRLCHQADFQGHIYILLPELLPLNMLLRNTRIWPGYYGCCVSLLIEKGGVRRRQGVCSYLCHICCLPHLTWDGFDAYAVLARPKSLWYDTKKSRQELTCGCLPASALVAHYSPCPAAATHGEPRPSSMSVAGPRQQEE